MQPALRSPVPSCSLLRFLKSQSDAAFLAHGNTNALINAGTQVCRRPRATGSLNIANTRSLTTSSRQRHAGSEFLHGAQPFRNGPPIKSTKLGFCTTATRRKLFESNPNTSNEPTWQERLWGTSAKKGAKILKPDDLPAHEDYEHGSSMFTSRRALAAKAALEPRLRCTEVDENGKVILVDGEFKKTELIAKVREPLNMNLIPQAMLTIQSLDLIPEISERLTLQTYPIYLSAPPPFS